MAAAVDAALPPTITCAPFYLNLVVVDSSAAVESKVEEKVGKGMFGLRQKAATSLAKAVVNDTKIAGKLAEKLTEVCVWGGGGGGCTGDVCSLAAGLNQNSNLAGEPSLTRATSRPAAASSPAATGHSLCCARHGHRARHRNQGECDQADAVTTALRRRTRQSQLG